MNVSEAIVSVIWTQNYAALLHSMTQHYNDYMGHDVRLLEHGADIIEFLKHDVNNILEGWR